MSKIKKRIQVIILLFSTLLILSSSTHPIKLTSSIIKYSTKAKMMTMECKVFIDDFSPAISPSLEKRVNALSMTKEDISSIESYFIANYKIFINEDKLTLKYTGYKVKDNVMTLSFSFEYIPFKKGDRLKIENELLFEKFPDLQSNWMTIQIPPFLKNYNFESNFENFTYKHTF